MKSRQYLFESAVPFIAGHNRLSRCAMSSSCLEPIAVPAWLGALERFHTAGGEVALTPQVKVQVRGADYPDDRCGLFRR